MKVTRWRVAVTAGLLAASALAAAAGAASASTSNGGPLKGFTAAGDISPGARPAWCMAVRAADEGKIGTKSPVYVWAVPCTLPSQLVGNPKIPHLAGFYQGWIAIRFGSGSTWVGEISPAFSLNDCISNWRGSVAIVPCSDHNPKASPVSFLQIGVHNAWEVRYPGQGLMSAPLKLGRPTILTWRNEKPDKYVQVWIFPEWKERQVD